MMVRYLKVAGATTGKVSERFHPPPSSATHTDTHAPGYQSALALGKRGGSGLVLQVNAHKTYETMTNTQVR